MSNFFDATDDDDDENQMDQGENGKIKNTLGILYRYNLIIIVAPSGNANKHSPNFFVSDVPEKNYTTNERSRHFSLQDEEEYSIPARIFTGSNEYMTNDTQIFDTINPPRIQSKVSGILQVRGIGDHLPLPVSSLSKIKPRSSTIIPLSLNINPFSKSQLSDKLPRANEGIVMNRSSDSRINNRVVTPSSNKPISLPVESVSHGEVTMRANTTSNIQHISSAPTLVTPVPPFITPPPAPQPLVSTTESETNLGNLSYHFSDDTTGDNAEVIGNHIKELNETMDKIKYRLVIIDVVA